MSSSIGGKTTGPKNPSFGRLIILPKKNWHIYKTENLARVQKDEAEHQAKEDAKAKRKREIESEARLQILKDRFEPDGKKGRTQRSAAQKADGGHINFFEDAEQKTLVSNEEYVKEQREKKFKEDQELKNTPVGLGSVEKMEKKPWWYMENTTKRPTLEELTAPIDQKDGADIAKKTRFDPLQKIQKHTSSSESAHRRPSRSRHRSGGSAPVGPDEATESKRAQMARLREARLAREREERARVAQLIRERDPRPEATPTTDDDRRKEYSTQFARWAGGVTRRHGEAVGAETRDDEVHRGRNRRTRYYRGDADGFQLGVMDREPSLRR